MKVIAAHNPDADVRRASSSGGVFSLIAEKVISEGGVVYGAAFNEEWKVEHLRVDTIEGLSALRGSKYVYSHVGSAYEDALADLESGLKVLFSGTPCQVAAMKKRAGERENLLLLEVICHGAPEPIYWERYLSELCNKLKRDITDITSVNFRDKRTGWKNYSFTVKFSNGKTFTQPHTDNLYMRAFLKDFTLREACFRCPFKYPEGSKADITLGDCWGITQIAPEIDNNLGTSLLVSKKETDCEFTSHVTKDKDLSFQDAVKYNPAITSTPALPANRDLFKTEAKEEKLLPVLKKFAGRPLSQKIYLYLAKLKHSLLH
ncbi:hypothetical protein HDR58_04635 [bacterium]|nr:hypothetical protein [bacterium]